MCGSFVSVGKMDEVWPRVLLCAYRENLEARDTDWSQNFITFDQVWFARELHHLCPVLDQRGECGGSLWRGEPQDWRV